MKYKVSCFLAALLFLANATAQNLVPNPSFEEYSECPTTLDGMHFVDHWYKSIQYPGVPYFENPSPDYFHECAEGTLLGVPENVLASQLAYLGQAYAGLATFSAIFPNHREVCGVELIEPLVPGVSYQLSMRVSLALGNLAGWATNNLGMKLSMSGIYSSSEDAVNNFSHVFSEEIITDTLGWTLIQGSIVADEPYQYLHIGNFFVGAVTETLLLGSSSGNAAYYYIDDVQVTQNDLLSFTNEAENVSVLIGPNPSYDELWVQCNFRIASAAIYDLNNKLINVVSSINSDRFNFNVQRLFKGMYILRVSSEDGKIQTKKFIKY